MNKLVLASIAGVAILSGSILHAQTLAAWTFDNDGIGANSNPTPSADNITGANGVSVNVFGMNIYPTTSVGTNTPDVLAGVSGDTGVNGVADTTDIFRVRSAAKNANGWSSQAPIGTQGVQFGIDTTGFNSTIQVSFDWYSTTQGEANLLFEYTDDGTDWIDAPLSLNGSDTDATVENNTSGSQANTVAGYYLNGGALGQNWYTDLTATITDPAAENDPSFAFRMVNATTGAADLSMAGTALNNSSGNWRFDNVQVAAVPEPATWASMLAGFAVLSVWQAKSRKRRTLGA